MDKALDYFNESLRLKHSRADTLDSRGFVYLRLGCYSESIADYDEVMKLNPKVLFSLYGRGLIKLKSCGTAGGNADMAAAKVMNPKVADRYANYGVAAPVAAPSVTPKPVPPAAAS